MPALKPLCISNHYFLQAKALPSHPHPDSSLTQLSKEKRNCLNTIVFKSCVNRTIAKLSLKQAKYNFSDLQDRKTEEESTSLDTYHISSRMRNVRSQEQRSQAPNHCCFASEALFSVCPKYASDFLPHMEHRPDCALSEAAGIARLGLWCSQSCVSQVSSFVTTDIKYPTFNTGHLEVFTRRKRQPFDAKPISH